MARVPYVEAIQLPPEFREQLANDSHIVRALANSPNVAITSGNVARYIRFDNKLDPRLREMAIIQVGYSMRCAYEYVHHLELGFKFGVSEADVRAIADETAGKPTQLEPLTKTVLRAAREMSDGIAILDATFAALKKDLDNENLVELVFAISTYTGVVRMLTSLQVDVEAKYQDYLRKFPLPTG